MAKPMSRKALVALNRSIVKWKNIVAGTGVDTGGSNCALCLAFPRSDCAGCPVEKYTGSSGCRGTPYSEFTNLADESTTGEFTAVSDAAIIAATNMLRFLVGLKPKPRGRRS